MKIHHLSAQEALESLSSSADGLPAAEAQRRLREFGPNEVAAARPVPALLRLLHQFTHFFALLLWTAAALAFLSHALDPEHGMALLGIAIVLVILLNGGFSFWQEHRAERMFAALARLLPHQAKVYRDGRLALHPVAELVPGDVVLLEEGDDVPADCRVVEAAGLRVNTATVTGEATPLGRGAGTSDAEHLMEADNILLAGTAVVGGEGRGVVFATGMQTEFGRIAGLAQTTRPVMSPLQREIRRMSRILGLIATLLGVVFYLIGEALGLSGWHNLMFAIGIIVANVPEGLLPTVTLALAMGSQRIAARKALVRHLPAVETLGAATVICTDKTGTLTRNEMHVRRLYVDGLDCTPDEAARQARLAAPLALLLRNAASCHNLHRAGGGAWLGDPMEIALVTMAQERLGAAPAPQRVAELPFDAGRKRMSVAVRVPDGLMVFTKGALESVLPLCCGVHTARGVQALDEDARAPLQAAEQRMAAQGLRVLAFAHRGVDADHAPEHLEEELTLAGLVALEDPLRPEVPEAIARCRSAGIKVIMVTGDHPATAEAVARQAGLSAAAPRVISGAALRRLSDAELQLALEAPDILFARVTAEQKLRIVQALRRKREVVAVTGDGVNDAPALKAADIGIAMGISGTDVAREAADIVLMDDNFATIVNAVEEGRAVFDNLRKFISYILTSNVPEIVPYLAFALFHIPLPLTVVQILAVDLGTDMLPALALGTERADPAVMRRPPRPRTARLLDRHLMIRAYLFLGVLEAAAAMAAFFFVLYRGGWQYGEDLAWHDPLYLQATTACLMAIIVMQVVNVLIHRSDRASIARTGVWGNPFLLWGIAAELLLAALIAYTALGHALLGTAPLPIEVWLFVLPFAALMLGLEELRKRRARRREGAATAP